MSASDAEGEAPPLPGTLSNEFHVGIRSDHMSDLDDLQQIFDVYGKDDDDDEEDENLDNEDDTENDTENDPENDFENNPESQDSTALRRAARQVDTMLEQDAAQLAAEFTETAAAQAEIDDNDNDQQSNRSKKSKRVRIMENFEWETDPELRALVSGRQAGRRRGAQLSRGLEKLDGEASALRIRGNDEEAAALYNFIICEAPNFPRCYLNLADIYTEWADRAELEGDSATAQRRRLESIKLLLAAAHLAPKETDTWLRCGKLCFAMGDVVNAAYCLQKAQRLQPENLVAAFLLGQLYLHFNEEKRALRYWRIALELDADDSCDVVGVLSKHYIERSQFSRGIRVIEEALFANDNEAEARQSFVLTLRRIDALADLHIRAHDFSGAHRLIVRGMRDRQRKLGLPESEAHILPPELLARQIVCEMKVASARDDPRTTAALLRVDSEIAALDVAEFADILLYVADFLESLCEHERIVALLRPLEQSSIPGSESVPYMPLLGKALFALGETADAAAVFARDLARINKDSKEADGALVGLAKCAEREGNIDRALSFAMRVSRDSYEGATLRRVLRAKKQRESKGDGGEEIDEDDDNDKVDEDHKRNAARSSGKKWVSIEEENMKTETATGLLTEAKYCGLDAAFAHAHWAEFELLLQFLLSDPEFERVRDLELGVETHNHPEKMPQKRRKRARKPKHGPITRHLIINEEIVPNPNYTNDDDNNKANDYDDDDDKEEEEEEEEEQGGRTDEKYNRKRDVETKTFLSIGAADWCWLFIGFLSHNRDNLDIEEVASLCEKLVRVRIFRPETELCATIMFFRLWLAMNASGKFKNIAAAIRPILRNRNSIFVDDIPLITFATFTTGWRGKYGFSQLCVKEAAERVIWSSFAAKRNVLESDNEKMLQLLAAYTAHMGNPERLGAINLRILRILRDVKNVSSDRDNHATLAMVYLQLGVAALQMALRKRVQKRSQLLVAAAGLFAESRQRSLSRNPSSLPSAAAAIGDYNMARAMHALGMKTHAVHLYTRVLDNAQNNQKDTALQWLAAYNLSKIYEECNSMQLARATLQAHCTI